MASVHQIMLWTLLFLSCLAVCLPYKILVLVPIPATSHFNLGKGIADILHERGHEVTIVSCFPSKKPAYREITVPELMETKDDSIVNFDMNKRSMVTSILTMNGWLKVMVEMSLRNPQVKKLMEDKTEKFDLIIIDHFLNDALLGFAVKFQCPIIALSPSGLMHWLARSTGNMVSPATVPNLMLNYHGKMNLFQRTANTAIVVFQEIVGWAFLKRNQAEIYHKFFPEEAAKVDFYELDKRIAMVLINSHHSIGVARPLLPNAVEIGGYHIGEVKPLTEEFQKIMDNAKDGVIFFSMGSNLKSSLFPENVRNGIMKSLAKLKQTVLWKFETDLPGKPDNVVIKKWMPQTSILAHPNVKLFISHGGLLSTMEATTTGVPILAIPIFGDQHSNAKNVEAQGNGLIVEYSNLTETSLTWALNELLMNPKYQEIAKTKQRLFNDRPMHPRDLVSFYAEHVIRTGGAKHLSPPSLNIFSALLLDVVVVLLLPPLVLLLVSVYLCRKCFKKDSQDTQKAKKNKQKKQ